MREAMAETGGNEEGNMSTDINKKERTRMDITNVAIPI